MAPCLSKGKVESKRRGVRRTTYDLPLAVEFGGFDVCLPDGVSHL